MGYHVSIVELIHYILSRGKKYLKFIDSGNAYDKILRNYHQFNFKGERVYRNRNLMQTHYRYTKEAWVKKEDISELYFEHLVPLKLIKDDLANLNTAELNFEKIESILNKTEIVVLTRNQAACLDKKFKSSLPKDGKDRLKAMGYLIEPLTEKNSIFN